MTDSTLTRFLAFDFGEKRLGMAIGNKSMGTTQALDVLAVSRDQPNWERVEQAITEWQAEAFVVGLPLNMDGSEQPISTKARKFANRLHGRFGLPVFLHDERLSSSEVKEYLFEIGGYKKLKSQPIDSFAAELILQSYFSDV